MTWRLAIVLLGASACSAVDPCAGWSQTCVALSINGAQTIDQLEFQLEDDVVLAPTRTPAQPGERHSLPVTSALHLHDATGQARLRISGLLDGVVVGRALQTLTFYPRRHQAIDVELIGVEGSIDASMVFDATADDGGSDGGLPDAAPIPVQRIFLLTARHGALGDFNMGNKLCTGEAVAAGLTGIFAPLLGYTTMDHPLGHGLLGGSVRSLVMPTGTEVATTDTFFAGPLRAPLNQLASGGAATNTCIWTNFSTDGSLQSPNDLCGPSPPWSSDQSGEDGVTRPTTMGDWTTVAKASCDANCHVICVEQ